MNDNGIGFCAGATWFDENDPCLISTVQPDGSILKTTVTCSLAPICGTDEVIL